MLAAAPPDVSEHRLQLGPTFDIVRFEQGSTRLLEDRVAVLRKRLERGDRMREQQLESLGFHRVQRQRLGVIRGCNSKRLQGVRPLCGGSKCRARFLDEGTCLAAEGSFQLQGSDEVIREHLRVVRLAAERGDPLGRSQVLLRPRRTWDLRVGDVADENMPKRVLALAREGGPALSSDEFLAVEQMQQSIGLASRDSADRLDRARPEDLPDNGTVLHELLLGSGQCVEASRDDALNGLGQRQVVRRATLRVQARELLCIERVPAGPLEQRLLRLRREGSLVEDRMDDLRGLLVAQRRQRDRESTKSSSPSSAQ